MRLRRPLRTTVTLLPLTAAVLTVVLLGASAPAQEFRAQGSSGAGPAPRAGNEFGIRVGSVTGLRPGGDVTVPVRYSNPFSHGLVVRSQEIQVASPSRACPPANVDLTQARGVLAKSLVVPARGASTVDLVLSMRANAPDGCQGVAFSTTVRAQGRKR